MPNTATGPAHMYSPNDRISAAPRVLAQRVNDGTVLFSIATESYFALNDTGATIWGLLGTGETTFGELLERTATHYPDAPRADLQLDLGDLIDELVQHGLIVRSADSASAAA